MNKSNERLMAILAFLRKLPRWALILLTVGVVVLLGIAMFLLLPQQDTTSQGDAAYLNSTGLAFSVFLKLGVVVLIIIGLAIVLKRWQSKIKVNQSKQVNLLETVHLTPKQSLYLVQLEGQKILIGATDQTLTTLAHIDTFESTDEFENKETSNFSDTLLQAKKSYGNLENEL